MRVGSEIIGKRSERVQKVLMVFSVIGDVKKDLEY